MRHVMLGVPIDGLNLSETLAKLQHWLTTAPALPYLVFTPNPEILAYAQQHPDFKMILQQGNLNLPDGTGVVWFSHGHIKQRVTGTDVVQALLPTLHAPLHLGCVIASQGLSTQAEVQQALPQAEVITEHQTFAKIPQVILVALGSPAQEQWMIQNRRHLAGATLIMGVGSSLDHLTGKQRRAPLIFQYLRLEWLWRLLTQPKRLKRILTATLYFPYLILTHHD